MQPNLEAVYEQEVKEKAELSIVWLDVEGRAPSAKLGDLLDTSI